MKTNDRRRFLVVLGASAASMAPGCGGTSTDGSGGDSSATGTASSTTDVTTTSTGLGGATTTTTVTSSTGGQGGASSSSSSTATSGGQGGAGGSGCMPPAGKFAGALSAYVTDKVYKVSGTAFLVGRDTNGLYAMSSLCTHQGCNINFQGSVSATKVHCNCHGSDFSLTGSVIQGPASQPLKHYAVAVDCMDNVYVDTSMVVSAGTRLAV